MRRRARRRRRPVRLPGPAASRFVPPHIIRCPADRLASFISSTFFATMWRGPVRRRIEKQGAPEMATLKRLRESRNAASRGGMSSVSDLPSFERAIETITASAFWPRNLLTVPNRTPAACGATSSPACCRADDEDVSKQHRARGSCSRRCNGRGGLSADSLDELSAVGHLG